MLPILWAEGDSGSEELSELSVRGLLRLKEFFALAKNVAALETVLLRRFLSPPVLWSSLARRPKSPVGGDSFF